jgi:hypothetical protein
MRTGRAQCLLLCVLLLIATTLDGGAPAAAAPRVLKLRPLRNNGGDVGSCEERTEGKRCRTPASQTSRPRLVQLDYGRREGTPARSDRAVSACRPDVTSLEGHWDWEDRLTGTTSQACSAPHVQHQAIQQYIHDCIPPKMCGHACAVAQAWVLTCCHCGGRLPSHQTTASAQATTPALLPPILEPFRDSLGHQQRLYSLVDDSAELSDADDHVHGWPMLEVPPVPSPSDMCWVCKLDEGQPPEYLALSRMTSSDWPLDDVGGSEADTRSQGKNQIFLPSREAKERVWEEGEHTDAVVREARAGESYALLGAWALPSPEGAEEELRCVADSVWERGLSIAAKRTGPWWLLRLLEEDPSGALPAYVRRCAAHDGVWYSVCLREGLVDFQGAPLPPFEHILKERRTSREHSLPCPRAPGVASQVDDGQGLARNRAEECEHVRAMPHACVAEEGDVGEEPVWLTVYLESKRAAAAVARVADRLRHFGGAVMHFSPGLAERDLARYEQELGWKIPYEMRLFYQHFDGQDPMARDGIFQGLRMLSLQEVVEAYHEEWHNEPRAAQPAESAGMAAPRPPAGCSPVPVEPEEEQYDELEDQSQLLALSEQSGFRRYLCAARTGAVWLESGFNVYFVAKSLTEFLSQQPGSRLRGNLQRGSRQRGGRQSGGRQG